MAKKYCDGIDCLTCPEKEPCIYKIANEQASDIERIQNQYNKVVEQNKSLQSELLPLKNEYFKDLPIKVVAELAKKSLRITTYQINAEELLDFILETIENASPQNAVRIIKKEINNFRKIN